MWIIRRHEKVETNLYLYCKVGGRLKKGVTFL